MAAPIDFKFSGYILDTLGLLTREFAKKCNIPFNNCKLPLSNSIEGASGMKEIGDICGLIIKNS